MRGIPIIDLFAGPGGLGEGFSQAGFKIVLSIEKDAFASQTLRLRSLCRGITGQRREKALTLAFGQSDPFLSLADHFPDLARAAEMEAWHATLGQTSRSEVAKRVESALDGAEDWVLLGGPPCQAYSLVGRSRMRTTRADFDDDHRHFLYREYLRIVATYAPPVFLMENVKGLISAKNKGEQMFDRILSDLRAPRKSIKVDASRHQGLELEYELVPVAYPESQLRIAPFAPGDYLVRSEDHGVPQARHRIFVLGLRRDRNLANRWKGIDARLPILVRDVIGDLPRIRSEVSRLGNGSWSRHVAEVQAHPWFHQLTKTDAKVATAIDTAISHLASNCGIGSNLTPKDRRRRPKALQEWYRVEHFPIVLNHESRSHMPSDLHRYMFASAFAQVHGKTPHLRDFPKQLLPNHRNVNDANGELSFDDRFRVQCWNHQSATIMSHISKDGHYYIHPDPSQCRSLTVREAARLQTFPDDYFFCGPRTQQYHQVGNAVPPYLAFLIAKSIKSSLFSS